MVVHRPVRAEIAVGYAPFGPDVPVPVDERGPFPEELSAELWPRIPESCRALRSDLPWSDPHLGSGERETRPEPRVRTIKMWMSFGCRRWNLNKAPADVQPLDTVILDLAAHVGSTLASMHPNHRSCVRSWLRRGVEVRAGIIGNLSRWHDPYRETASGGGFVAEDRGYLEDLQATVGHHDPDVQMLLVVQDGELLSGSIIATGGAAGTTRSTRSRARRPRWPPIRRWRST